MPFCSRVRAKPLAKFTGAVEKVFPLVGGQFRRGFTEAQPGYDLQTAEQFAAADEDCAGFSRRLCDKIQAVVHAVDQVNVCCSRRREQGLCPAGAAVVVGVAGLVTAADVSLRFCDPADKRLPSSRRTRYFPTSSRATWTVSRL